MRIYFRKSRRSIPAYLIFGCQLITLFLLAITLISCASPPKSQPPKIAAFKNSVSSNPQNAIRLAAIRDTAASIGAQAGLAWRYKQIDDTLKQNSNNLDNIFNFNALLLRHDVLPPVLVEADNPMKVSDNAQALRLANKTYKIITPPRFVTTPPTWRQYLWRNFKKPDAPNSTLLPRTPQERKMWNKYIVVGWHNGIHQANEIFSANLGRLRRDMVGMALYRKLLAQDMVSPPFVASTNLGVTGGENQLRLNDQVLRITSTSKLKSNSKKWKPVLYNFKE